MKESLEKEVKKKKIRFSRIKRRFLKNIWLARITLALGVLLAAGLTLFLIVLVLRRTLVSRFFNLTYNFLFTPAQNISQIDQRTNLLILGRAGPGADSPDLTDTIIFTSVDHQDKKISLISLPRDIWIPELRAKLNSIYYWGNQKEDQGGPTLAKAVVEQIVGQPVPYHLIVDFSGFTKMIDVLEGVEVEVETSFKDEKYPIAGKENEECFPFDPEYGCRYETIEFQKGRQLMNGETALKFVRSRNAEGDEGTDLARAARQQKIILGIKEKVLSKEVLLNPKKMKNILEVLSQSIETDLDIKAMAILARRALQSRQNTKTQVLPEELLLNPPQSPQYDNLYVFIPKTGDWAEIQEWINKTLN